VIAISWRQVEDGRVATSKEDALRTAHKSFPSRLIELPSDADRPGSWVVREVTDIECVMRWIQLEDEVSRRTYVPVAWIMGMVYAESRGNERAEAPDGGWGLMQITHPSFKAGLSKEQVFDPYTNLMIGARIVARHARQVGIGIPGISSCYNAGGKDLGVPWPSTESPWGMRETPGHISRVVAASNALFRVLKEGVC